MCGVHKREGEKKSSILLMLFNYAVKRPLFLWNDQLSVVSDNGEWWPHALPLLYASYRLARDTPSEREHLRSKKSPDLFFAQYKINIILKIYVFHILMVVINVLMSKEDV